MESAGVRYLRTRCFCIRNLTRSPRSLVRFLIRQQLVRKYRTPALSMKYSLFIKFPSCGGICMQINSLYIETTTGLIYCKVKPRLHGSGQFFERTNTCRDPTPFGYTAPRSRASF